MGRYCVIYQAGSGGWTSAGWNCCSQRFPQRAGCVKSLSKLCVCDLRCINSSDEWELQRFCTARRWSVEEHRWWVTAELRLEGSAPSTALATLLSPQWRSCTFLLCLYKNVLSNSFQETKASCTSHCPAASLGFQVLLLREKCSWQTLPFPYSDNFTELNKKQLEKFKLFSAACSVAAANRAGSWQQDVTHWWCILNVDPKRVAPASGRLLLLQECLFSAALSPERGYNLTEEILLFVPWQARPEFWLQVGSTSPIPRIRGAILVCSSGYSNFTAFHSC